MNMSTNSIGARAAGSVGAVLAAVAIFAADACVHMRADYTSSSNCVACTAAGPSPINENASCSFSATEIYRVFCSCEANKNCEQTQTQISNHPVRDYENGTCQSGFCRNGSWSPLRFRDFMERSTVDCPGH